MQAWLLHLQAVTPATWKTCYPIQWVPLLWFTLASGTQIAQDTRMRRKDERLLPTSRARCLPDPQPEARAEQDLPASKIASKPRLNEFSRTAKLRCARTLPVRELQDHLNPLFRNYPPLLQIVADEDGAKRRQSLECRDSPDSEETRRLLWALPSSHRTSSRIHTCLVCIRERCPRPFAQREWPKLRKKMTSVWPTLKMQSRCRQLEIEGEPCNSRPS